MSVGRDPKGYYVALGVAEDADEAAIKSAFRAKAKRLHPDFNPSPIATKQFHRLHEAYATLLDPSKRAAYDRPWKQAQKAQTERPETRADTGPRARPEPPPRAETKPPEEPRAPEPPPRRVEPDAPVLCQCGQITAQPRYALFDMVWGRGKRVQRRTVSGVFCRTCADRAAIRASLVSWIAGWWAWPDGPRETIRAILNNVRGGRKPADRNARLLLRQARAFKGRGDLELARNAALQARSFAQSADVRREVDAMIAALGPLSGRVLKDRWRRPGWAPTVQLLPLAGLGAVIAVAAALALPRSLPVPEPRPTAVVQPLVKAPAPKPAPRVFTVTSDAAALRTGPNEAFEVITLLPKGERLTSLETDPGGAWLRVMRGDGVTGFVTTGQIAPAP